MKTWKLLSGIISIIMSAFILFQSCAAGIGNTLSENGETSGSIGFLVAILLLVVGIVSIVVRSSEKNGGNIAITIMSALAAILGFTMAGNYADLRIWAVWCLVCAILAVVDIIKRRKTQ